MFSTFADDVSRYPYLIRMLPPDTKQSLALIDLVEAFRWKKLTILTSNTDYGRWKDLHMVKSGNETPINK